MSKGGVGVVERGEKKTTKPLQIIDPKLYRYIVEELNDRHNIHSYDTEILATKEDSGLTIIIKYGENFTHSKEELFIYETLKNRGDDFIKFVHEVADECKEVMIAEYFKMMKP